MKPGTGTFPLRLPRSTRQKAIQLAQFEGLSLNQFIALAVTEKIVRMEIFDPYVAETTTGRDSASFQLS